MPRTWLITGISRGIGAAIARAGLDRGETVIGTTRTGTSDLDPGAGTLHVLTLDVTNEAQARAVVERAHELGAGRIDVLVNNAGHGLLAAIEDTADDEARELFDANVFGVLNVTRAALPLLREQGGGAQIVNISSIAALAPTVGSGVYAATKAAVNGFSGSLAQEVEAFGIGVTLVELGSFRTDFLARTSMRVGERRSPAYEGSAAAARIDRLDESSGRQAGDPARAAAAIVDAVASADPPLHLVLGSDAIERARTSAERLLADVARWEDVSRATAFESE